MGILMISRHPTERVDEDDDRTFTRTDPLIVEMRFWVDGDEKPGLWMDGRAYPGISSGSRFSRVEPLWIGSRSLKERIDRVIESETRWLHNAYPKRPLKLKVTRPDVRQLTLAEAV
jgi:hypothetical protein